MREDEVVEVGRGWLNGQWVGVQWRSDLLMYLPGSCKDNDESICYFVELFEVMRQFYYCHFLVDDGE